MRRDSGKRQKVQPATEINMSFLFSPVGEAPSCLTSKPRFCTIKRAEEVDIDRLFGRNETFFEKAAAIRRDNKKTAAHMLL